MPMLELTNKSILRKEIGCAKSLIIRAATKSASEILQKGSKMTYSSPPNRATKSLLRMDFVSRCPTSINSWSPIDGPLSH